MLDDVDDVGRVVLAVGNDGHTLSNARRRENMGRGNVRVVRAAFAEILFYFDAKVSSFEQI